MLKETKISQALRLVFASGAAISFGMLAQPAFAQQADTTAAPVQRVEITGSSIKRVESEGSLPVQTVTRADIDRLGVTSTEELLNTITANSAVGGTFSAQGAGASTYGESTASLRGLGSNKTLVLVNGRRLANYATDGTSVDINSIPLATVDHVEILKDGASGVYGSDAIAGVINFILRKNFTGFEVTAKTGKSMEGGGASTKVGAVWGIGNYDTDHYNIMFSVDASKDVPIYGSQRSYANHSSDEANGLFDNSATPSGALKTFVPTTTANSAGIIPNTLKSQGSPLGNPLSPNSCAQNGSYYDQAYGTCRFNSAPFVPLTPDVSRQNFSANMRFKLNESNEFFIDSFVSHTLTKVSEQPSPYSVSFMATDQAFASKNIYPAIILSPTNPNYPTSYLAGQGITGPVTVSYRAFDAGGRQHSDTSDQIHFVAGFRGSLFKDYDYDIAYVHNSSKVVEATQGGYQSMTALASLLSNNNAFNPFTQYQTPALAAQIKATNYNGNMINSSLSTDTVEGKISGDLFQMPAGPASFAAGAAVRNENMDYNPSAAYQSGDISGYGGQALTLSASRHSMSVFGELAVPLLKTLEGDLALRTDKYPNATSTNPKVSLRFQPVKQVLFRASYGKGFREAALPELFTPNTIGTSASFTDPVTGVKNQWTTTSGGNANLNPEKSKQWSLGVAVDATKDLSFSVDYWKINITQLVTTLTPQFIVDQAAAGAAGYTSLVTRDSNGNITNIQSTNLNAGGVNTNGIDIDLKWQIAKTEDLGKFGTHLNATYTHKYDEILADGTVQPSVGATLDASGNALNAVASGILFKWKYQLAFDWNKGVYGASLIQNYQSGYFDNIPTGFSSQTTPNHVGSLSTWDLQGSYTGFKNLILRAGIKNVFDKKPPAVAALGQYFQSGYDPSYYDPHERDFYVTAKYSF